MKKVGVFFLCIGVTTFLYAKEKRARSAAEFNRLLSAAPYSLVVFYDRSKNAMRDDDAKNNTKDMEIMIRSLSKNPLYKGADLQFVRVDVSRRDLSNLLQTYAVTTLPTFMVFVGRQPYEDRVTGFAYRSQVNTLITSSLQEKMAIYMKEKERQRQRELERARIRAYNRAYLWGWGPYWYTGYYPYWRGPYYRFYW